MLGTLKSHPRLPAVGLAGVLFLAGVHAAYLSFLCDDAFITYRYAHNLAVGNGPVFNPGERVEGYTSPSWMLLCAGIHSIGLRPEDYTRQIGAAFAMAGLAGMMVFRRRHGHDYLVFGTLTAASGAWAAWSTGGLETGLFTALAGLAFVFHTADRFGISASLLAIAALTRPEGLLVGLALGIPLALRVARGDVTRRDFISWGVAFLLPVAAHFVWRTYYYGTLVPNTALVKAGAWTLLPQGLGYLAYCTQRLHLWLLLVPVALTAFGRTGLRSKTTMYAAVVTLPYLTHVAVVGGDFMDMFRFVVPILPIVFVAIGDLVVSWLESRPTGNRARSVVAVWISAYVALNLLTSVDSRGIWHRRGLDSVGQSQQYVDDWTGVGMFLATVGTPADTLATTAAGCIPYYSGMVTIDQLGLTAPDLDDYQARSVTRPGHGLLLSSEALFRKRPQFLVGGAKLTDPSKSRPYLFVDEEWGAAFAKEYRVVSLIVPQCDGKRLTFAVRNDVYQRLANRFAAK